MRRPGGDQVIPRPANVWVRPYNPWSALDLGPLESAEVVASRVTDFAARFTPLPPKENAQISAVLIGLSDGPHGAEVILTKRSKHMRTYTSEISLPGGRMEESESPHETALREAWEEISLLPERVQVIGELAPVTTSFSRTHIVPVVGLVDLDGEELANNHEVERIIRLPLIELVREDTFAEEHWGTPPTQLQVFFFYLDDETVWGATARMLHQLISIALL